MDVVSTFMGDTRGSDVLSSAGGVLEMSVVRGVICTWFCHTTVTAPLRVGRVFRSQELLFILSIE